MCGGGGPKGKGVVPKGKGVVPQGKGGGTPKGRGVVYPQGKKVVSLLHKGRVVVYPQGKGGSLPPREVVVVQT